MEFRFDHIASHKPPIIGTVPVTHAPSPKSPEDSSDSDSESEGEGREYSGEIEIPNLSDENEVDEIDVCVMDAQIW